MGTGGETSLLNFIIFYTAFIIFLVVFTGFFGVGLLKNADIIPNSFSLSTNPAIALLEAISIFITLLLVGVVPEFNLIFILVFVPYLFGVVYVIWKALPFT